MRRERDKDWGPAAKTGKRDVWPLDPGELGTGRGPDGRASIDILCGSDRATRHLHDVTAGGIDIQQQGALRRPAKRLERRCDRVLRRIRLAWIEYRQRLGCHGRQRLRIARPGKLWHAVAIKLGVNRWRVGYDDDGRAWRRIVKGGDR